MATVECSFSDFSGFVDPESLAVLNWRFGPSCRVIMPKVNSETRAALETKPSFVFMLWAIDILGWRGHLIWPYVDKDMPQLSKAVMAAKQYWDGSQKADCVSEGQQLRAHFCRHIVGLWHFQEYVDRYTIIDLLVKELVSTTSHFVPVNACIGCETN
jgi:hypothetical protein